MLLSTVRVCDAVRIPEIYCAVVGCASCLSPRSYVKGFSHYLRLQCSVAFNVYTKLLAVCQANSLKVNQGKLGM